MALQVSKGQITALAKRAEALQARAKNALAKADKAVATVVEASETGVSAFAFGLLQGKTGGIEVAGVPLELGAAVALHGMGFMGVGGSHAHHLHAFGNGALASYLTTMGRGAGLAWKEKAKLAAAQGK